MFSQVVGTILRLTDRHADRWLAVAGLARRARLRLRAGHRSAAPRGQRAPAARASSRRGLTRRRGLGGRCWTRDADVVDAARRRGRRAAARRASVPIGRRPDGRGAASPSRTSVGARSSTTCACAARERGRAGWTAWWRRLVPDLLRPRGQPRDRDARPDHRPGGGVRGAAGARLRAGQAARSSARWTARGRAARARRRARPAARRPRRARRPASPRRRRPPQRILIPLANPRTAADLVRIGSALLAPRRQR